MSKNKKRPKIGDFWDDCIKFDLPKKSKQNQIKPKSNSIENINIDNNSYFRNNNRFLKNHKLLKNILRTEETIPKNKKKYKEKQIEKLISKYNEAILNKKRVQKELNQIREKKMMEELKDCTFKPEKKYKKNKSCEKAYNKNFGQKKIYDRDKYYKKKYENKMKELKKEVIEELEESENFPFKPKIEQKNIYQILYGNNLWEKRANNFSNKVFLWRYMKARQDESDKKKRLIWSLDKTNDDFNNNDNGKLLINNNKIIHRSISQKDSLLYKKSLHFSLLDFRTKNDEEENNDENIMIK